MKQETVPVHSTMLAIIGATIGIANTRESLEVLEGTGLAAIVHERIDQIEKHGFTPEHDLGHPPHALGLAAASYLNTAIDQLQGREYPADEAPDTWPWPDMFKPTDARGNVIKALAIGWALLDRIEAGMSADVAADPPARVSVLPVGRHAQGHQARGNVYAPALQPAEALDGSGPVPDYLRCNSDDERSQKAALALRYAARNKLFSPEALQWLDAAIDTAGLERAREAIGEAFGDDLPF